MRNVRREDFGDRCEDLRPCLEPCVVPSVAIVRKGTDMQRFVTSQPTAVAADAMTRKGRILLGLLLFNGCSAAVGGLALMMDWIPEQASWVRDTDFSSNYFPGVILMAVVGGSSLIAAAAQVKRSDGWQLASIVAGTIMLFWIIGEVASIRGFHFLQLIYLVTGALVVILTPARDTSRAER